LQANNAYVAISNLPHNHHQALQPPYLLYLLQVCLLPLPLLLAPRLPGHLLASSAVTAYSGMTGIQGSIFMLVSLGDWTHM
jgi:hypothetical protein